MGRVTKAGPKKRLLPPRAGAPPNSGASLASSSLPQQPFGTHQATSLSGTSLGVHNARERDSATVAEIVSLPYRSHQSDFMGGPTQCLEPLATGESSEPPIPMQQPQHETTDASVLSSMSELTKGSLFPASLGESPSFGRDGPIPVVGHGGTFHQQPLMPMGGPILYPPQNQPTLYGSLYPHFGALPGTQQPQQILYHNRLPTQSPHHPGTSMLPPPQQHDIRKQHAKTLHPRVSIQASAIGPPHVQSQPHPLVLESSPATIRIQTRTAALPRRPPSFNQPNTSIEESEPAPVIVRERSARVPIDEEPTVPKAEPDTTLAPSAPVNVMLTLVGLPSPPQATTPTPAKLSSSSTFTIQKQSLPEMKSALEPVVSTRLNTLPVVTEREPLIEPPAVVVDPKAHFEPAIPCTSVELSPVSQAASTSQTEPNSTDIPSMHDPFERHSIPARLNDVTNAAPNLDAESKPPADIENASNIGVSRQTESIKTKTSVQRGQTDEIVKTVQKISPGQTEASLQPDPVTPAQKSSPEVSVSSQEKTIVSLPTPKRNPLHAFSLDTDSPPRLAVASRRMCLARHFASREEPPKRLTSAVSLDSPPRRTAFRRLNMTAAKPSGSHVDRWSSAQQEDKPPHPPPEPVSETDEREEQLLVQQRQLDKLLMGMEQRRQAGQEKEREKLLKAMDTTAFGTTPTGNFSNVKMDSQSSDGELVDNASFSLSDSSLHSVSERAMQSMPDYDDMMIDGVTTDESSQYLRSTAVNNTSLALAEDPSSRSQLMQILLPESRRMAEEMESDATRSFEAQRTRNDSFDDGSLYSDLNSGSAFLGSTNSICPPSVAEALAATTAHFSREPSEVPTVLEDIDIISGTIHGDTNDQNDYQGAFLDWRNVPFFAGDSGPGAGNQDRISIQQSVSDMPDFDEAELEALGQSTGSKADERDYEAPNTDHSTIPPNGDIETIVGCHVEDKFASYTRNLHSSADISQQSSEGLSYSCQNDDFSYFASERIEHHSAGSERSPSRSQLSIPHGKDSALCMDVRDSPSRSSILNGGHLLSRSSIAHCKSYADYVLVSRGDSMDSSLRSQSSFLPAADHSIRIITSKGSVSPSHHSSADICDIYRGDNRETISDAMSHHHSTHSGSHSYHNFDNSYINEGSRSYTSKEISSAYTVQEEFFEDPSVNTTSSRLYVESVRSKRNYDSESGHIPMSSEHSFCSRSGGRNAEESTTGLRSEYSEDESQSGTCGSNRYLRGTDQVPDKSLDRSYNSSSRSGVGQGAFPSHENSDHGGYHKTTEGIREESFYSEGYGYMDLSHHYGERTVHSVYSGSEQAAPAACKSQSGGNSMTRSFCGHEMRSDRSLRSPNNFDPHYSDDSAHSSFRNHKCTDRALSGRKSQRSCDKSFRSEQDVQIEQRVLSENAQSKAMRLTEILHSDQRHNISQSKRRNSEGHFSGHDQSSNSIVTNVGNISNNGRPDDMYSSLHAKNFSDNSLLSIDPTIEGGLVDLRTNTSDESQLWSENSYDDLAPSNVSHRSGEVAGDAIGSIDDRNSSEHISDASDQASSLFLDLKDERTAAEKQPVHNRRRQNNKHSYKSTKSDQSQLTRSVVSYQSVGDQKCDFLFPSSVEMTEGPLAKIIGGLPTALKAVETREAVGSHLHDLAPDQLVDESRNASAQKFKISSSDTTDSKGSREGASRTRDGSEGESFPMFSTETLGCALPDAADSESAEATPFGKSCAVLAPPSSSQSNNGKASRVSNSKDDIVPPDRVGHVVTAAVRNKILHNSWPPRRVPNPKFSYAHATANDIAPVTTMSDNDGGTNVSGLTESGLSRTDLSTHRTTVKVITSLFLEPKYELPFVSGQIDDLSDRWNERNARYSQFVESSPDQSESLSANESNANFLVAASYNQPDPDMLESMRPEYTQSKYEALAHGTAVSEDTSHGQLTGNKNYQVSSPSPALAADVTRNPTEKNTHGDLAHNIFATQVTKFDFSHLSNNQEPCDKPAAKEKPFKKNSGNFFAAKSNYFSFSPNEDTTEEMTASKSAALSSTSPDAPLQAVVKGKQPSTEASVDATKRVETKKPKDDEGLQISGFLSTLAPGPGQFFFGLPLRPPVFEHSCPDHALFRNPFYHPVAAKAMEPQSHYLAYSETDAPMPIMHGFHAPQYTFDHHRIQPMLSYPQCQSMHASGPLGGFEHPLYLQQQVNQHNLWQQQQQHNQLWLEQQKKSQFRSQRPLQQAFQAHTVPREEISTSVAQRANSSEIGEDALSAEKLGLNQFSDMKKSIASDKMTSKVMDEVCRKPVRVQSDVDAICDTLLGDPSSTMSLSAAEGQISTSSKSSGNTRRKSDMALTLQDSSWSDETPTEMAQPGFSFQSFLGHVAEQFTEQVAEIFGLNDNQDDIAAMAGKCSKDSQSRYSYDMHSQESLPVTVNSGKVSPTFVSYEEAMILFRKPELEVKLSRPPVIQIDDFCTQRYLNRGRSKDPWETLDKDKPVQKDPSLALKAGIMGYWYAPNDEVAAATTAGRSRILHHISELGAKMSEAKALKIIGSRFRRKLSSVARKASDLNSAELSVEYEIGEEKALSTAERAREAKALSNFGARLREKRTRARITISLAEDSDEEPEQPTCDKTPGHDPTIEPGQGYEDTETVESDSSIFTTSSDERRREILAQAAPKVRSELSSSGSSFTSSFSETGSYPDESNYSGSSYWSGSSYGSSSYSSHEDGTTIGKQARDLVIDLQNEDGDVLTVLQKEMHPNIDSNVDTRGEVVIEYVQLLSTSFDKNVEEANENNSFLEADLRPPYNETDDDGTQRRGSHYGLDRFFQPNKGFATLASLLWGVKDAVQPEFAADDFENWGFSDEDEKYDLADFELADDEMDQERGAPSRRRSSMIIKKPKFRRRKNRTEDASQRWNNIWFRPPKLYILVGSVVILVLIVIFSATQTGSVGKDGASPAPFPIAEPTPAPMTHSFADRTWNIVGDPLATFFPGDQTGFSVSISNDGSRVAVGARRASEDGLARRGNAKIYSLRTLDGRSTWIEEASFDGYAQGDQFGFSVKLSSDGRRLAVGSIGDDTNGSNSGLVRVFGLSGTIWQPIGEFLGESEGDLFGLSVDLSANGQMLCVGAPYHSANGQSRSGKVYFYQDVGKTGPPQWESRSELFGVSLDDFFGWSLALNADASRVAIGAPSSGESGLSGYARMYQVANTGTIWTRLGQDISINNGGDRFGYSVSMDAAGDRVAAGAFRSADTGEVNVFELNANSWVPLGDSLMGDFLDEGFGFSISLSADGNYLAVGAPSQDNIMGGTGIVRVFEYQPTRWLASQDIVGMGTAQMGNSVALSSGATRVAVGSPSADEASVYE